MLISFDDWRRDFWELFFCGNSRQTVARNESEESYRELLRQKDIYTVELEHFVSSLQETLSKEASENE